MATCPMDRSPTCAKRTASAFRSERVGAVPYGIAMSADGV